jgi:GGDEF domain-containing protein
MRKTLVGLKSEKGGNQVGSETNAGEELDLMKYAINNLDCGFMIYDDKSNLLYANDVGIELTNKCEEKIKDKIRELVASEKPLSGRFECNQQERGGRSFRYMFKSLSLKERDYFFLQREDITDLKIAENTIAQLAHYDGETGLPNYILFRDRLNRSIFRGKRHSDLSMIAAMEIKIGSRNDSIPELLIIDLAQELSRNIRKSDTLCRFSRREFLLLAEELKRPEDAESILKKLKETFESWKRDIPGCSFDLSFGYSLLPVDGVDPETLVSKAFGAIKEK